MPWGTLWPEQTGFTTMVSAVALLLIIA
jgi:hypothetical protein